MANAQQSNNATSADTATNPDQAGRELVVQINPTYTDIAAYQGSRAQLEAEWVIPPEIKWPESRTTVRWTAGKLTFHLHRIRPEGMKGPMRDWLNGDWWSLSWHLTDRPDYNTRTILKKKAELAEELRRQSPAAKRVRDALWLRYWESREDEAFQAFKGLVPGLIPPKRGRKAAPAG